MIELGSERILTLTEAAGYVPGRKPGKKAHVSTLHRWAQRGVNGIRLETQKLGGVVVTSLEALQRFSERCTNGEGESEGAVTVRTSRARKRAIAKAERELDRAGIN